MKFITVCLVIASAVIQINGRALLENSDKFEPEESCVIELHLKRGDVRSAVNQLVTPEDNDSYGRFFICVWKKRGVMDEEGNVNAEKFRQFLEQLSEDNNDMSPKDRNLDTVVTKCTGVRGHTAGQTGIKLKNCMAKVAMGIL